MTELGRNPNDQTPMPWWVYMLVVLSVLCIVMGVLCCQADADYPPGGLMFSRYVDEWRNTTPGFENHGGVIASDGQSVVESLAGQGVVKTPMSFYEGNREVRAVVYPPLSPELGARAAQAAESMIGRPYRTYASVLANVRPWNPATNCVSVQHQAYEMATGRRWWWAWTPDGTAASFYRFTWGSY